jgi:hypothetical protein
VRPEGLGKLIKIIHLIGSRTRDLPACSIVPQPLRYRVSKEHVKYEKAMNKEEEKTRLLVRKRNLPTAWLPLVSEEDQMKRNGA